MLEDKPEYGVGKRSLTAYISRSRDREGNIFYTAAICDDEKTEIIHELSDYSREDLETEVHRQYPQIQIENG